MATIATAPAPAVTSAPATLADKPVFIPAPRRKALMHADVPALVARYIIGADDALVRPSDIRQSVAVLKTGMGAAAGLESFINGLAGIAARLAWGAITPDQAAGGLPDFSAWAVREADKAIVSRKGIRAGLLRALVADVVQRTAALPVRTTPAKAKAVRTISAPAQADDAPAVDRVTALAELARMTRAAADAPINTRDAIPHQLTEAEAAEASAALDASAARIKAEAEQKAADAARVKAEAEERVMAELTAAGQSAHLRAVAFCRLADAIGIKLTKGQLATLDAFEGKRTKVPA
jgi:hypothetical protein